MSAAAQIVDLPQDTHADCLRMIVRAEMRMADEIDQGHARGDVATRESNLRRGPDVRRLDIGDLGHP